ncbi:MAG: hypothetical protein Q3990_07370 [Desulfovibrionaceae bacterium]|nr:hypothetical protein [Desulfovibrionaceae bacterium]
MNLLGRKTAEMKQAKSMEGMYNVLVTVFEMPATPLYNQFKAGYFNNLRWEQY